MRGPLIVIVVLLAGATMMIVRHRLPADSGPAPITTEMSGPDPRQPLDTLPLTPAQREALLVAGLEIQKGILPSRTMDARQLAAFPEIERTLTAAVCPPAGPTETCARERVDVARCLDRAAEIVAWRRRAASEVDRKLFIAAMGVSVTGREFPSFPNLVRFCREMARLDPGNHAPQATVQR